MAALLAGLPVDVPGSTFNRLCGSGLDAIASAARAIARRRYRSCDRRRRGEHEPRALRHAQSARAHSRARRGLRYDDRLALRQSGDEGAVRHRQYAGDRRERCGTVRRLARRPRSHSRCARSSVRPPRSRAGGFALEIVPIEVRSGKQSTASIATSIRARRRSRSSAIAADAVSQRRHGDCGQRLGRQRRCGSADRGVGARRRTLRPDSRARASSARRRQASSRASWASARSMRRAKLLERTGLRLDAVRPRSNSTKPSPRRVLRRFANSACRMTPSTSTATAERSRSAIRSA